MEYLPNKINDIGTSSLTQDNLLKIFLREELKLNKEESMIETESHGRFINDTFSSGYTYNVIKDTKPKKNITETIREWWIGEVLEVNDKDGYFVAVLKDRKRIESVVEFDISSAFENSADKDNYLFPGANFAFSIFTKHGSGAPETSSRIEFTTPYIWKEDDEAKVNELFKQLFPNDKPLED